MNRIFYILILMFFYGCSSAPTADDPIARVNGLVISVRDYLNLYDDLKPKDISLHGVEKAKIKNLVIQTLVRRAVILSNAAQKNIQVTDKELIDRIQKIKSGYPDQIFQEVLLEGMVDEEEWKELVRQNLLIEKMFEATKPQIQAPTIEEALNFYQNNSHLFQKQEEVICLHIVVGDKKVAEDIRSQLLKKNTVENFKNLARQHSIGPEAQESAELRLPKGMMPEEIDKVIFHLDPQKISPVVESPYGFHIFRVLEKLPAVNLDFKQVRQQIFERLYEEQKQEWLEKFEEDLIRTADIEYNRSLIGKL